ncbi:type I methionyl aminopeptidase [Persicirhabdus sediminis]|uniref:Methionine aminopeptidase n=1 Tax=Persicirhabdus sediminis TaxID=454144 RepID=A0A8J7MBZ1_9BACT|nr:type I methionyl aminopeptidase [Persicirhabdus sediminis]MBK1789691.1 type I methionyl aminopeptidase [Persicirhabdus sediminis]
MAKKNRNKIPIKSVADVKKMRIACETASTILQAVAKEIKAGVTTGDIDQYSRDLMAQMDVKSAFLGYRGFAGNICISVNEEVVHGIGGSRPILSGDIVSVDIGVVQGGWIGDNATTVGVGEIDLETKRLLAVTEQSLYEAISFAKEGERLGDLCAAVEDFVVPHKFSIVREFVGHGVGRRLHEEPQVPNYRPHGRSPLLKEGMVLAIEPMVNAGVPGVKILEDGWTVITNDKKYSAHFEHTVLVTKNGPDILTARPREATPEILGIEL